MAVMPAVADANASRLPRSGARQWLDRLTNLPLPLVLLVAAALRLGWILACANEPVSDQIVYHQAAVAIAEGRGFVDVDGHPHGWWPVGYSAALAPFHWLFGSSPRVGHAVNLGFGLLAVFALHRLARALAGPRVAVLAALLLALHPTSILMTTVLALENLYIPIFLAALAVLAHVAARSWLLAAVAVGGLLGLGAYVRAPSVLLIAAIPIWLLASGARLLRAFLATLAAVAIALLLLVPWGMRTQREFGTFQLFSMNGMSNLWMGNHPGSDGGYHELPADVAALSVPERERELGARAIRFISAEPSAYLVRCFRRSAVTLRSDTIAVAWNEDGLESSGLASLAMPLKTLTTAVHWLVLGGAIASLWRRRRVLDRGDLLLVVVLGVLAFPFVAIVGGNRYHLPLAPVLLLLVARLPGRFRSLRDEDRVTQPS
jgi:4-amino-4-deoxy-L-arabinose transferase-like glycosyltransferase